MKPTPAEARAGRCFCMHVTTRRAMPAQAGCISVTQRGSARQKCTGGRADSVRGAYASCFRIRSCSQRFARLSAFRPHAAAASRRRASTSGRWQTSVGASVSQTPSKPDVFACRTQSRPDCPKTQPYSHGYRNPVAHPRVLTTRATRLSGAWFFIVVLSSVPPLAWIWRSP